MAGSAETAARRWMLGYRTLVEWRWTVRATSSSPWAPGSARWTRRGSSLPSRAREGLGSAGTAARRWMLGYRPLVAWGVDGSGNLFIADLGNNRIRQVDSAGVITTIAGPGALGDAGPATAARLWRPAGVAVDGAGQPLHRRSG